MIIKVYINYFLTFIFNDIFYAFLFFNVAQIMNAWEDLKLATYMI